MPFISPAQIVPIIMVTLSVLAGIGYLFLRDYPRAVYWFSAASINTTVTWFIK